MGSRGTPNGDTSGGKNDDARSEVDGGVKKETKSPSEAKTVAELIEAPVQTILCKQASTWHLAYGLLGMDVGYSSDEGGDEEVAYYIEGVDGAFTRENEVFPDPDNEGVLEKETNKDEHEPMNHKKLPIKKTEFSIIGKQSQLQLAMSLTSIEPDVDD